MLNEKQAFHSPITTIHIPFPTTKYSYTLVCDSKCFLLTLFCKCSVMDPHRLLWLYFLMLQSFAFSWTNSCLSFSIAKFIFSIIIILNNFWNVCIFTKLSRYALSYLCLFVLLIWLFDFEIEVLPTLKILWLNLSILFDLCLSLTSGNLCWLIEWHKVTTLIQNIAGFSQFCIYVFFCRHKSKQIDE
jgi:hypothetical protein